MEKMEKKKIKRKRETRKGMDKNAIDQYNGNIEK